MAENRFLIKWQEPRTARNWRAEFWKAVGKFTFAGFVFGLAFQTCVFLGFSFRSIEDLLPLAVMTFLGMIAGILVGLPAIAAPNDSSEILMFEKDIIIQPARGDRFIIPYEHIRSCRLIPSQTERAI